jgi:hypothetical protein
MPTGKALRFLVAPRQGRTQAPAKQPQRCMPTPIAKRLNLEALVDLYMHQGKLLAFYLAASHSFPLSFSSFLPCLLMEPNPAAWKFPETRVTYRDTRQWQCEPGILPTGIGGEGTFGQRCREHTQVRQACK